MAKNFFKILTPAVFFVTVLLIGALYFVPSYFRRPQAAAKESRQTKLIVPQAVSAEEPAEGGNAAERLAYEDTMTVKIPLGEGESLAAVLTQDFDGDQRDEQILAYRNLLEAGNPIFVAYAAFDEQIDGYRRMWSAPTAAERPGTVTIYTQDLIGDRSLCILVSGMTGEGEHTLTVFRKNDNGGEDLFTRIAELRIDGSITVRETERTNAYERGLAPGKSFMITAYGRDTTSSNILDQVEITYAYNSQTASYEQSALIKVPGTQIEQRRVRELLSGRAGVFENFIAGLWYYVSPQGTLDSRQYIYFDPGSRELIFYGDEIQQVFHWQNSSATRYGIYVSSQNISVTTLKRFLDIELETLDSLRIRVFEDVRLKINVNDSWDGSYRKAGTFKAGSGPPETPAAFYLDAVYHSSIGKMRFLDDGAYELSAEGSIRRGRYSFFHLEGQELLELRPGAVSGVARETYLVERTSAGSEAKEEGGPSPAEELTLLRVRLGTKGVERVHEAALSLALEDRE